MTIWLDAQLALSLARWLSDNLKVRALSLRDVGLRTATDPEVFAGARKANVAVMTKDVDFLTLLERHGPPPQVIWVTCGNTSNARMKEILTRTMTTAFELLEAGEALIEIRDL